MARIIIILAAAIATQCVMSAPIPKAGKALSPSSDVSIFDDDFSKEAATVPKMEAHLKNASVNHGIHAAGTDTTPAPTNKGPLAFCNSGGGLRAQTQAMAIAKAMVNAGDTDGGIMDKVDYMGCISGGNWFTSMLAYDKKYWNQAKDRSKTIKQWIAEFGEDWGTMTRGEVLNGDFVIPSNIDDVDPLTVVSTCIKYLFFRTFEGLQGATDGDSELASFLENAFGLYVNMIVKAFESDQVQFMSALLLTGYNAIIDKVGATIVDWLAKDTGFYFGPVAGAVDHLLAVQWQKFIENTILDSGSSKISQWSFDNTKREGLRTTKLVHLVDVPPSVWQEMPDKETIPDRGKWWEAGEQAAMSAQASKDMNAKGAAKMGLHATALAELYATVGGLEAKEDDPESEGAKNEAEGDNSENKAEGDRHSESEGAQDEADDSTRQLEEDPKGTHEDKLDSPEHDDATVGAERRRGGGHRHNPHGHNPHRHRPHRHRPHDHSPCNLQCLRERAAAAAAERLRQAREAAERLREAAEQRREERRQKAAAAFAAAKGWTGQQLQSFRDAMERVKQLAAAAITNLVASGHWQGLTYCERHNLLSYVAGLTVDGSVALINGAANLAGEALPDDGLSFWNNLEGKLQKFAVKLTLVIENRMAKAPTAAWLGTIYKDGKYRQGGHLEASDNTWYADHPSNESPLTSTGGDFEAEGYSFDEWRDTWSFGEDQSEDKAWKEWSTKANTASKIRSLFAADAGEQVPMSWIVPKADVGGTCEELGTSTKAEGFILDPEIDRFVQTFSCGRYYLQGRSAVTVDLDLPSPDKPPTIGTIVSMSSAAGGATVSPGIRKALGDMGMSSMLVDIISALLPLPALMDLGVKVNGIGTRSNPALADSPTGEYRFIDGGYVDNSGIAFTTAAMIRDAPAWGGTKDGTKRMRLVGTLHDDITGDGTPEEGIENKGIRLLFAQADAKHPLPSAWGRRVPGCTAESSAEVEVFGKETYETVTCSEDAFPGPGEPAPGCQMAEGALSPLQQIWKEPYPFDAQIIDGPAGTPAVQGGWRKLNTKSSNNYVEGQNYGRFWAGTVTTVDNRQWGGIEAGWKMDVLLFKPACDAGVMFASNKFTMAEDCGTDFHDAVIELNLLKTFEEGGAEAVNQLFAHLDDQANAGCMICDSAGLPGSPEWSYKLDNPGAFRRGFKGLVMAATALNDACGCNSANFINKLKFLFQAAKEFDGGPATLTADGFKDLWPKAFGGNLETGGLVDASKLIAEAGSFSCDLTRVDWVPILEALFSAFDAGTQEVFPDAPDLGNRMRTLTQNVDDFIKMPGERLCEELDENTASDKWLCRLRTQSMTFIKESLDSAAIINIIIIYAFESLKTNGAFPLSFTIPAATGIPPMVIGTFPFPGCTVAQACLGVASAKILVMLYRLMDNKLATRTSLTLPSGEFFLGGGFWRGNTQADLLKALEVLPESNMTITANFMASEIKKEAQKAKKLP